MTRPQPRASLGLVAGYHSPQVDVDVRLNTNESPEPPPADFLAALSAEVARLDPHRYPDREASELRAAIGELHGVEAGQVLLGNGSNEVLQAVCLAYGGPDRTALTFEPTYALHSHIAEICGTAVAHAGRAPDHTIDLEIAADAISTHQPELVFVCSPNNPTGTVETPETVMGVVDLAPGLVVVDEAYAQFAPWSALTLVDDERPLVVSRTFSKTWAMAALRLGYLVGPRWVVEQLEKVVLPYHVDALKQTAGLLALRFADEMDQRVARITEERGRLVDRLDQLDVDVTPSGANFVLFRPRSRSADEVWQALVDHSVLVRNCASWPHLEGCLRVTVGTRDEDDRFLDALEEVVGTA